MNNIPQRLRKELAQDPDYQTCIRYELFKDHKCESCPLTGKLIEWEHCLIYAGKQIQEKWAIIPICYLVHRGGMLNKEMNEWFALSRATDEELRKYSKAIDLIAKREYLSKKYGNYREKTI